MKEEDMSNTVRGDEQLGKFSSRTTNDNMKTNNAEKFPEDANNQDSRKEYIEVKNLNEMYKAVFENSAVAITLTDENERIISWNNHTETLLGMSREDLHMKPVSSLYPQDEWKKIRSENVRQKGIKYHLETKMVKKNKEIIDVEISLSVLKDNSGKTMGSIGIIMDITKSKQMEKILKESEEKFKQLYENAPVAYHTLSPNGDITDVNEKWCQIFGCEKKEIIGKPIFHFIDEKEREAAKRSFIEKIQSKKSYTGGHERTYIDKNGKERIFVINDFFSFDENNNVKSIHTTMEDITQRKQMEKELRDIHEVLQTVNKELERKVSERTAKIEKLLQQKDEFIGQLSHDLKTPVSVLMNVLPVIEEVSGVNAKKECEIAIQNVYYIKNLITETLKIAEMGSPKVMLNTVELNLRESVDEIIKNKQIASEKENIIFENNIDKKICAMADKLRFKELIDNIVTNAIKYMPETGGTITLDANEGNNFVVLSIKDTGIGMTEEQISNCFDEFYKADKSRHNLNSVGLGLSICKRIVEKHGGKLWVESRGLGKGSTFYFTFKKAGMKDDQTDIKKKETCAKQKIMLVDDNTDFTYVVKKRLESISQDCEVISANSGKECFKILEQGNLPDIILLDVMMPDMEGWDVFTKIKEKTEWREIPIVFLTAKTDSFSKGFGNITAEGYIEKPIEIKELKERIDEILNRYKNAKKF